MLNWSHKDVTGTELFHQVVHVTNFPHKCTHSAVQRKFPCFEFHETCIMMLLTSLSKPHQAMGDVTVSSYGKLPSGEEVSLFTLTSGKVTAKIITFGAVGVHLLTPPPTYVTLIAPFLAPHTPSVWRHACTTFCVSPLRVVPSLAGPHAHLRT